MPGLLTVELHHLRFFAYHGLYADERKTGNEFEVNLSVLYEPAAEIIQAITDTINYVTLFEIIKKQMQQPVDLLETFLMKTAAEIHASFPQVKKIELSVTKLHPPISGFTGNVAVKYSQEY